MVSEEIKSINLSARDKAETAEKYPFKYLVKGIMAGFYLSVAVILSYTLGAMTYDFSPIISKMLPAFTFSLALVLICLLGADLFTGNCLTMGIAYYDKKEKFSSVVRVLALSYLGNLIGCIIIGFVFIKSGSGSDIFPSYLSSLVEVKTSMDISSLVLKGILCNFVVCIATYCNFKLKSESAKMIAMFWLIAAFVIAGFEHSIANMGVFSISFFTLGTLPWAEVMNNMLWVTLGNIIGGGVLYALPLYYMSKKTSKVNSEDNIIEFDEILSENEGELIR